ncbi:hypothetical protein GGF31_007256 [Allomyces arbusculus]|nr:hypothetical protein GGF31_007256 [Allomyces arbusculus]
MSPPPPMALHLPPLSGPSGASTNDAPLSLPTPPRRLANTSRRSTAAPPPLIAVMAPDGSASTARRRSQWGAPTASATTASSAPPARSVPPTRRLRSTTSLPAIPAVAAAISHSAEPRAPPPAASAPVPASVPEPHIARLAAAAHIARLADLHNLPHVSAALATDVPDLASSRANHARLARAVADGRFADAVRLVEAAAPSTETRSVVDLLRSMQWRELRDAGREDAARAVADTVHDRERICSGEVPRVEEVWRAVRVYVAGAGVEGSGEGWVPLLARWFWHYDDVSGEVVDRWSGGGSAKGAIVLSRTDSGTVAVDHGQARERNGKVDETSEVPPAPSWTASPASSATSSRQSSGGKLGSEPASLWLTDSTSSSLGEPAAGSAARSAATDPLTFPAPDPNALPPVEPLASWTAGQPPTLSWIDQHGPFHAPVRFFDVTEYDGSDIAALILDSSVLSTASSSTTSTHAPAAADRRIYLWDLTQHRLLPHLTLHSAKPVSYLSFLPADAGLGAYLVAADLDFAVHIWHWPTGARTTFKKWHRRIIHQVAYMPLRAPLHLVSCSGDHSMRVWAPEGDAQSAASVHANQPFLSVCFVGSSADSQILVAAQAYALRLYKSRTLTHLHTFHVADLKMHRTPIHHLCAYPTTRATAHTRWTHPDGTPFGANPPNWVILTAGPTILIFDVDLGAVRAHLASRDLDRRAEAARAVAERMGGSAALAGVLQPPIRPKVSPCGTFVYVAGGAAGVGEVVVWRCVSGKWERVKRRPGGGGEEGGGVNAVPHVAWVRNDRVYACGVAGKSVVVAWAVG